MAVEGSLELFRLPEILQIISQEHKTGILTVQGESDIIAISFLEGQVVAADALNQTLEEGLGEVLAREGLVDGEEFQRAVEDQKRSGGRLIDVLVRRDSLSRADLLHALRLQTYELLTALLRWDQGEFKFYGGDEVSYEEGFEPIPVEELLLRSLEQQAEEPEAGPPEPAQPGAEQPRAEGSRISDDLLAEPSSEGGVPSGDVLSPLSEESSPEPAAPSAAPPRSEPAESPRSAEPVERPGPRQGAEPPRREPQPARVRSKAAARPARRRADAGTVRLWLARSMALVGLGALAWSLVVPSGQLLLPAPWDGAVREHFENVQRRALYGKLERALDTHYLLESRFPERLEELRDLALVRAVDLRDPVGRQLLYSVEEGGFRIAPEGASGTTSETAVTGTVRGNFLLDPAFLAAQERDRRPPLVLLD